MGETKELLQHRVQGGLSYSLAGQVGFALVSKHWFQQLQIQVTHVIQEKRVQRGGSRTKHVGCDGQVSLLNGPIQTRQDEQISLGGVRVRCDAQMKVGRGHELGHIGSGEAESVPNLVAT